MRGTVAVVIPLKTPRGSIKALLQREKDQESALQFINLLRNGKIGAITARPYGLNVVQALRANRLSSEDLETCEKGRIVQALGTCTECLITEWNNVKP